MCSGCNAARTYQNAQRRYDDPPAAELVQDPQHKWKFYTREVLIRRRNFQNVLAEGRKALAAVEEKRLALGRTPDVEAQRAVYEAFQEVDMYFGAGAIMSSLDLGEAIAEAQQGLTIVNTALPPASDRQRQRNRARQERLERYDSETDATVEAWREQLSAEGEALKAALPNYDEIIPKYVCISEAGW